MRINQPIGIFLLLWPTLWGLWIANSGIPTGKIIILFITEVICMRSAGCVINDYIDYNIDGDVQRTKNRPLIDGTINKKEALIVFLILISIAAGLVLTLNILTICLAIIALLLSLIYPFLKRYIYFPQLVLGIVFSFPILMACTASNYPITSTIWLLCAANTVWTISYDTQYAMVDRNDDQNIAIKSSALLFGKLDRIIIGILQLITVSLLTIVSYKEEGALLLYFFAVIGPSILFIWQQILIYNRNQTKCFIAFLSNNYIGLLVFIGIFLHLN